MIHHLYLYRDADIYLYHASDAKPDGQDYFMHTHNMCEILGCIRGKGKYMVEGREYDLEPGCLIITRPMEAHRMFIDPEEPYERIMINFSYDVVRKIDPTEQLLTAFTGRPLGEHNLYHASEFPSLGGLSYLRDMVTPAYTAEEQRLNVLVNLYPLLNHMRKIFDTKNTDEMGWVRRNTPQLIIDYVNEHLHEDLSLDTLSEQFFLSRSQISRIFKKSTGSSVLDYIIIKRLMRAREYLMDGESPGRACQLCGFDHYSSFYRAYRKRFGVSPSDTKAHAKMAQQEK